VSEVLRPEDFRGLDAPLSVELNVEGVMASIELAVEAVQDLPAHRYREAPFSLLLRGPRSPVLHQATYLVGHPHLGQLQLFVVPIAQDALGTRYEVTFN
jgi:hypothetical protein